MRAPHFCVRAGLGAMVRAVALPSAAMVMMPLVTGVRGRRACVRQTDRRVWGLAGKELPATGKERGRGEILLQYLRTWEFPSGVPTNSSTSTILVNNNFPK
eukprot:3444327-Rhodomonas_salina.1